MTIILNVNQINYLLDTYFDENLYEVFGYNKNYLLYQEFCIKIKRLNDWPEVYVNGKFYTTINNQYYKEEFEKLLSLKD